MHQRTKGEGFTKLVLQFRAPNSNTYVISFILIILTTQKNKYTFVYRMMKCVWLWTELISLFLMIGIQEVNKYQPTINKSYFWLNLKQTKILIKLKNPVQVPHFHRQQPTTSWCHKQNFQPSPRQWVFHKKCVSWKCLPLSVFHCLLVEQVSWCEIIFETE